jgi:RNA polymerase sigma factor (sigma-70 family)
LYQVGDHPQVLTESQNVITSRPHNHSGESDRELVQRCATGDRASFCLLYRRHQQRVRGILYQLGDPTLLDDLVQEVFLRAWQGLPKFRQTAQFSTWLYRIAWNVAADHRQGAMRRRSQLFTLSQQAAPPVGGTDLMQLHYQDLVQRGLQHLSFDHRTVLVLHDLEAVPQKDIAEILAIPVGTVKSRLFHARTAMRQFLQKEGIQL